MNLEQLNAKLADQVTVVDGWRIGKLNFVDGLSYSKLFAETSEDASFEVVSEAYAFLLSKSVVDEHGHKTLDSDEGRERLQQLDRATFSDLGKAALEWNSADAKKN